MNTEDCLICERSAQIKTGTNPYFVAELETGYVVLGDFQFFHGYTLFLCKVHVTELHELEKDFRQKYLEEMSLVAEAVYKTFKPVKLNYELLGNTDEHLHWHLFPRHANDPRPLGPVWNIDKELRNGEAARPSSTQLEEMRNALLENLPH